MFEGLTKSGDDAIASEEGPDTSRTDSTSSKKTETAKLSVNCEPGLTELKGACRVEKECIAAVRKRVGVDIMNEAD